MNAILVAFFAIFSPSFAGYHHVINPDVWRPEKPRPVDLMVDITNNFGLKIFNEHNYLNDYNIGFSPYGLAGMMIAIYEGVDGSSRDQICDAMHLPKDGHIVRIGFRDIHRRMRSYFLPEEGFLAGLSFNHERVWFRPEYIQILKYYGFDYDTMYEMPSESGTTTSEKNDPNDEMETTTFKSEKVTTTTASTTTTAKTETTTSTKEETTSASKEESTTTNKAESTTKETTMETTTKDKEDTTTTNKPKTTSTTTSETPSTSNDETADYKESTTENESESTTKSQTTTTTAKSTSTSTSTSTTTKKPETTTTKQESTTKSVTSSTSESSSTTTEQDTTTEIPEERTQASSEEESTTSEPDTTTTPKSESTTKQSTTMSTSESSTAQETTTAESETTEIQDTTTTTSSNDPETTSMTGAESTTEESQEGSQEETTTAQTTRTARNTKIVSPDVKSSSPLPRGSSEFSDENKISFTTEGITNEILRTQRTDSTTNNAKSTIPTKKESRTVVSSTSPLPRVTVQFSNVGEDIDQPVPEGVVFNDVSVNQMNKSTTVGTESIRTKMESTTIVTTRASKSNNTNNDDQSVSSSRPPSQSTFESMNPVRFTIPLTTEGISLTELSTKQSKTSTIIQPTSEGKSVKQSNESIPGGKGTSPKERESTTETLKSSTTDEGKSKISGKEETTTVVTARTVRSTNNIDPSPRTSSLSPRVTVQFLDIGEDDVQPTPAGVAFNELAAKLVNDSGVDNSKEKRSLFTYTFPYNSDEFVYHDNFPILAKDNHPFENSFMVSDRLKISRVTYMSYDTILEYGSLPYLRASALKLPLDTTEYYLLIILPNTDNDVDELISMMQRTESPNLRQIQSLLRPTRVHAWVPSFKLDGNILFTSDLIRLRVRDIFYPRNDDFYRLSKQRNVSVKNIVQTIQVNIRKYKEPNFTKRYIYSYSPPITFAAKRPFVYFVMDSLLNVALIMGKIVDPTDTRIQ